MKKLKNKNLIIILIIAMLSLVFLGAGAVILNLNVKEDYEIYLCSDTFSIDSTNTYHIEENNFENEKTIIIKRKHRTGFTDVEKCDLIIYSDDTETSIDCVYDNKSVYDITNGKVIVFSAIEINENKSEEDSDISYSKSIVINSLSEQVNIVVVKHSSLQNEYIQDTYGFEKLNNEKEFNNKKDMYVDSKIYSNIYIIDSFSINKEIVFTVPTYINFLYSDITLNKDLTIKHTMGGMYSLESITGKIINEIGKVYIDTPNAYYSLNDKISNKNNYTIISSYSKLTENNDISKNYLSVILNDACDYALSVIPDNIFNNISLYDEYQSMDINFEYEFSDSNINTSGVVNRGNDTTSVTITVNTIYQKELEYEGENKISKTKTVNIIGKSDKSEADFLSAELDKYINNVYLLDERRIKNFKEKIDLKNFFEELIAYNYSTEILIKVNDENGTYFDYNGESFSEFYIKKDNENLLVKYKDNYENLLNSLYITPSSYIYNDSLLTISIKINGSMSQILYTLDGYSYEELLLIFEKYKESYYFTNENDIGKLVNIKNGGLYRGNDDIPFVNSTFSFTTINSNNIYLIPIATYQSLIGADTNNEKQTILNDIVLNGKNYNDKFIFDNENNTFKIEKTLSIDSKQKLILIQDFYSEDNEDNEYYSYNDIIIPSNGIGGTDYTKYLNSEYELYFAENRRLIDSTADTDDKKGTAKSFVSTYPGVKIKLEILTSSIESFCNIVKRVTENNEEYYQININVDNIPSKNTDVKVLITIYYIDETTDEPSYNEIASLQYSFIIPGIYKLGTDFEDENFYSYIVNYKVDDDYVYESFKGYLLVDGAKNENEMFDATELSGDINIKGISLLTNTRGFKFKDCNIQTLEPLSLCSESQIEYLSIINGNIDDDKLLNYLQGFKKLENLNLSFNNITKLVYNNKCIFYRAIKELDISSQKNLTEITGINYLVELNVLDISSNKIRDMRPLNDCDKINKVYLYGNTCENYTGLLESKTFFGTNGEINIPVYVEMLGKNIEIYKKDKDTILSVSDNVDDISSIQNQNSLILNAIGCFNKIESSNDADFENDLAFPLKVTIIDTSSLDSEIVNINKNYYITDFSVVSNNQIIPTTNGTNVDIIVSVTRFNVTVYKMFTVVYITQN